MQTEVFEDMHLQQLESAQASQVWLTLLTLVMLTAKMLDMGQVTQFPLVLHEVSAIQLDPERVYPKTQEVQAKGFVGLQVAQGLMHMS